MDSVTVFYCSNKLWAIPLSFICVSGCSGILTASDQCCPLIPDFAIYVHHLTFQSALHNLTTEMREQFFKPSIMGARHACLRRSDKSKSPIWLEDTILPFGNQILNGLFAICWLTMEAALMRNLLDAPKSKIPHNLLFGSKSYFWENYCCHISKSWHIPRCPRLWYNVGGVQQDPGSALHAVGTYLHIIYQTILFSKQPCSLKKY